MRFCNKLVVKNEGGNFLTCFMYKPQSATDFLEKGFCEKKCNGFNQTKKENKRNIKPYSLSPVWLFRLSEITIFEKYETAIKFKREQLKIEC